MQDPRLKQLASLLLNHSMHIKEGELFGIRTGLLAKPLIKELMKEAHRIGAVPYLDLRDEELQRLAFGFIDPENPEPARAALKKQAEWERALWSHWVGQVVIGVEENDAELSAADPRAIAIHKAELKEIRDLTVNERRWVYLHWPTKAAAQKAEMCYDDFYEFFLNAALVDYDEMERNMRPLVALMQRTDKVRLLGKGTDLTLSIRGMNVIPCAGEMNIPDGEVFTAPLRESANGVIQYNTPLIEQGKRYDNPRFVFENGKIVEASCGNDTKGLNALLDTDEGARYLGEFAIGVNNAVTKPIGNTLYDEKIGGSFHLTPGAAYDSAFNGNRSVLHMDIVCMQAQPYGGEIYFDGVCIRRDGLFTLPELAGLNPKD